jgi:cytochrome c oxidase subunit III
VSAPRDSIDVSRLPDFAWGHRDVTWWGTAGFTLIEGMSLAILLASYFYLSRNFESWPPPRTAPPDLFWGTATLVAVLLNAVPITLASRAARRLDVAGLRRWMVISCVVAVVVIVCRSFEMATLHTRWDDHAYGSVVWGTIVVHTTLVVTDIGDSFVLTGILLANRVEVKHLVGAGDNSLYWWFVVVATVATYAVVHLSPRLM